MVLKRSIALSLPFTLLLSLASCSFNPFTTHNDLTGSATGAVAGGAIGAGGAALLGAQKYAIALAGIGGAAIGYYMTTVDFAAGGISKAGGQVFSVGDYVTIEIPTDSIFEENSSDFLPSAGPALDSAVSVLEHYPNNNIMVSGNTSGFGARRYELRLSEARARQVAAYLWAHGVSGFKATDATVPTRKLIYVGYGNYFPIANDIRAASIRQNSRIQITGNPTLKQLGLCKDQKIFGNIGGLQADPIKQAPPEPYVGDAFKGDLLPSTQSATQGDGFSERAPSYTTAPSQERGGYKESASNAQGEESYRNQNSIAATEAQTPSGGSVVKQGGFTGYKGDDVFKN